MSGTGSRRIIIHLIAGVLVACSGAAGVLEDYLAKPDDTYQWMQVDEQEEGGLTVATLDLASQTWRGRHWIHKLYIGTPHELRNASVVFLQVAAGANSNSLHTASVLAERAGARVAVLTAVPNQPLFEGRKEDQIIAYTFDQYFKSGDAEWPVLLPMVKSVVKAMDAVQGWARKEHGQKVDSFVVSGISKRGWTTWLTGAVDSRVAGLVPVVFDMLNMHAQTDWAAKVYGRQSEQIHDYTELGLVDRMGSPEMERLQDIVDPCRYRARYAMPKLIILGTNDRFWTVDSLRHYWPDLPGPKSLYQAPGIGHHAGDSPGALRAMAAFFTAVAGHHAFPVMTWTTTAGHGAGDPASIAVAVDRPADRALLWRAASPTRDFRSAQWRCESLRLAQGGTKAQATVTTPRQGYEAFLIELAFGEGEAAFTLSSQVLVTPDRLPY